MSRNEAAVEALRKLVAAANAVPVVRRNDKAPFSTCLGCKRTDGKPCTKKCWVSKLEAAVDEAEEELHMLALEAL